MKSAFMLAFLGLAMISEEAAAGLINVTDTETLNLRAGGAFSPSGNNNYYNNGSGSDSTAASGSFASSSNSLGTSTSATSITIQTAAQSNASSDASSSAYAVAYATQSYSFGVDSTGLYILDGSFSSQGTTTTGSTFSYLSEIYLLDQTTGIYLAHDFLFLRDTGNSSLTGDVLPLGVTLTAGDTYEIYASSTSTSMVANASMASGSAQTSLSITTVPEPPSVALAAFGCLMVGLGYTRKHAD